MYAYACVCVCVCVRVMVQGSDLVSASYLIATEDERHERRDWRRAAHIELSGVADVMISHVRRVPIRAAEAAVN